MKKENEKEYIEIIDNKSNTPTDIANKVSKFLPKDLYRYRCFNPVHWRDEIFKGQIYLAQASTLNDPMDCLAYFDFSKLPPDCNFIKYLKQKLNIDYDELMKLYKNEDNIEFCFQGFREDIRTASFSEFNNSLLMWSHYTNMHEGFCIHYKTERLKNLLKGVLYPAIYSNIKPNILEEIRDYTENAVIKALIYKAKEWEYENEWRVILPNKGRLYLYQIEAIETIYLGAKCSEDNRKEVIEWAQNNNKRVIQMKVDLKDYKLTEKVLV